jgi:hypothetical protein
MRRLLQISMMRLGGTNLGGLPSILQEQLDLDASSFRKPVHFRFAQINCPRKKLSL